MVSSAADISEVLLVVAQPARAKAAAPPRRNDFKMTLPKDNPDRVS
jgi:hypothetical protein